MASVGFTIGGKHYRAHVTDEADARAEAIEFATFAGASAQAFGFSQAQALDGHDNWDGDCVANDNFFYALRNGCEPVDDRPVVCIDFDAQKFYDDDHEFDLEWLGRGGKVELPRFAQGLMKAHSHGVDKDTNAKDYDPDDYTLFTETQGTKFNVVSSQIATQPDEDKYQLASKGGKHLPLIDLDFDAALIPSSQPGHYHLYLDKPMSFDKYAAFTQSLFQHGIIAAGNANQMERKSRTFLRLPWVKKGFLAQSGPKN